jgi:hypothetical protein
MAEPEGTDTGGSTSGGMTLKKKVLAARQARAEGRLTAADITSANLQRAARRPIVLADPDPTDDVVVFDLDPTDAIIVIGV